MNLFVYSCAHKGGDLMVWGIAFNTVDLLAKTLIIQS